MVSTWRNAHAVCFDVDSTVCEDEGIDELAAFCGAGEAVAAWTARFGLQIRHCNLRHLTLLQLVARTSWIGFVIQSQKIYGVI